MAKPINNPYFELKQPGVRGKVQTERVNIHHAVYTRNVRITIRTGEIEPGIWDFGYIYENEGKRQVKLPGEGNGWFKSERDAILYACGGFRMLFDIRSEESESLVKMIQKQNIPESLF